MHYAVRTGVNPGHLLHARHLPRICGGMSFPAIPGIVWSRSEWPHTHTEAMTHLPRSHRLYMFAVISSDVPARTPPLYSDVSRAVSRSFIA